MAKSFAERNADAIAQGYKSFGDRRQRRAAGDFTPGDDTGREWRQRNNPTQRDELPDGSSLWTIRDKFDLGEMRAYLGFTDHSPYEPVTEVGRHHAWYDEQGARLTQFQVVTPPQGADGSIASPPDHVTGFYDVESEATGGTYDGDLDIDWDDFEGWDWDDFEDAYLDDQAGMYGHRG